mmetsp:Transcript_42529/g.113856  ORF Transcript_42529/g.113856 Transcript_42529/m.113856 type:complete len:113 (+) Transcript_42529:1728-2066(+)
MRAAIDSGKIGSTEFPVLSLAIFLFFLVRRTRDSWIVSPRIRRSLSSGNTRCFICIEILDGMLFNLLRPQLQQLGISPSPHLDLECNKTTVYSATEKTRFIMSSRTLVRARN